MNKEKIAAIVGKVKNKLNDRKSAPISTQVFGPPSNYAPPHAIWFQTQDKLKAFVSLVNNKYKYEIYNKETGKPFKDGTGSEETLALAKKEVFKYFKEHEEK